MTKGSTGRSNQKKPIDEERETNMKAAASTNVSDFSVPPRVNPELSYSDLVPNNQRVLLRTQVVEEETDDPQPALPGPAQGLGWSVAEEVG